jgi:hypothetical protein
MKLEGSFVLYVVLGVLVKTVCGSSSSLSQSGRQPNHRQPPQLAQFVTPSQEQQQQQRILQGAPEGYVDDIYHCENPDNVDLERSIPCNRNTWMWRIDKLEPDEPPSICGTDPDFRIDADQVDQLPDEEEPCLLWLMTYGYLKPETLSPTASPSGKLLQFL